MAPILKRPAWREPLPPVTGAAAERLQLLATLNAAGVPIIELRAYPDPDCKKPKRKGWRDLKAENQAEDLRRLARGNVGMPTGSASRLVVVDLDVKTEDDVAAIEQRLGLDRVVTPVVVSPTGGRHYYFNAPADVVLKNLQKGFDPSTDTRGEGGYVVLPGSTHPNGGTYEWAPGRSYFEVPVAPLPADLLAKWIEAQKPAGDEPDEDREPVEPFDIDSLAPNVRERLQLVVGCEVYGATYGIVRAPEGTGHAAILGRANRVGNLIGAGLLDADAAESELFDAVERRYSDRSGKIPGGKTTVRDGIRNGSRFPVDVAEWVAEIERDLIPFQKSTVPPVEPVPEAGELPLIEVSKESRETFDRMVAAMVVANEPTPKFFATLDGGLARIDGARLAMLSPRTLFAYLARSFQWQHWRKTRDSFEPYLGDPSESFVRVVSGSADFGDWLPVVETVSTVPVLNLETGESFAEGYDENSRTLVVPMPGLVYEPNDDARAGIEFLREELLADFPFVSDADRSNALAALLTHATATSWGDNSTPLFLADAPIVGSGKSLFAEVCAALAGVDDAITAVSQDATAGELDKVVTATMREGRAASVFDNLKGKVASTTLAAIATGGRQVSLRVLATSDLAKVRGNLGKILTGNNLVFDADLARRMVRVRIDPKDPQPSTRTGFRHPNLLAWVREHRGELIAAAHSVIRGWIRAGRPDLGAPPFGSFGTWAHVIGNALRHAGVEGFLGNRDQHNTDDDADTLRAVLEQLLASKAGKDFAAAEVLDLAQRAGADAKNAKDLGTWFGSFKERRVRIADGRTARLERAGETRRGASWRVAVE